MDGVTSTSSSASWSADGQSGSGASAIKVVEVSGNRFDVFVGSAVGCPGGRRHVPDGPISQGSANSDAVRQIQHFSLPSIGIRGIDGDFYPLTESAVRAFRRRGLAVDGIWNFDDATRAERHCASTSSVGWARGLHRLQARWW